MSFPPALCLRKDCLARPSRRREHADTEWSHDDTPTAHVSNGELAFLSSEKAVPDEIPVMEIGTLSDLA